MNGFAASNACLPLLLLIGTFALAGETDTGAVYGKVKCTNLQMSYRDGPPKQYLDSVVLLCERCMICCDRDEQICYGTLKKKKKMVSSIPINLRIGI